MEEVNAPFCFSSTFQMWTQPAPGTGHGHLLSQSCPCPLGLGPISLHSWWQQARLPFCENPCVFVKCGSLQRQPMISLHYRTWWLITGSHTCGLRFLLTHWEAQRVEECKYTEEPWVMQKQPREESPHEPSLVLSNPPHHRHFCGLGRPASPRPAKHHGLIPSTFHFAEVLPHPPAPWSRLHVCLLSAPWRHCKYRSCCTVMISWVFLMTNFFFSNSF